MRRILLALSLLIFTMSAATPAWSRSLPSMRTLPTTHPTFTYDISASSGTENNNSYSELKINLNWFVTDWLNWKNGVFTRFGSNIQNVNGLDSALLATFDASTDDRSLGVQAFAGPGVRMASADN